MEPHPLERYALDAQRPAVVVIGEESAVVLDYASDDTVWVWRSGKAVAYPAALPVVAVSDEDQARTAVQQALVGLEAQRLVAQQQLDDAVLDHRDVLRGIRLYVITKYRQRMVDRENLDAFLKHFGFAPYHWTETRIEFTITGAFRVASGDAEAAAALAAEHVAVGVSDIRQINRASLAYQVRVDEPAMVAGGETPQSAINFEITGSFVVNDDNLPYIQQDLWNHLQPDLSAVAALVPGSQTHYLRFETAVVE